MFIWDGETQIQFCSLPELDPHLPQHSKKLYHMEVSWSLLGYFLQNTSKIIGSELMFTSLLFMPGGLNSLTRFIRKSGVHKIWMCKRHCQTSSTCVGFVCVPVVMSKTTDTLSGVQITFGLGSLFFRICRNFAVILYFADYSWMSYNCFLKQKTIYNTEFAVEYRSSAYAVYSFTLLSVS